MAQDFKLRKQKKHIELCCTVPVEKCHKQFDWFVVLVDLVEASNSSHH